MKAGEPRPPTNDGGDEFAIGYATMHPASRASRA